MSGLVDSSPPGGSIVPYRNFTPPPETPDKLAVSVTPGSKDQYAIGSHEQIASVPDQSQADIDAKYESWKKAGQPGSWLDWSGQSRGAAPQSGQPTDLTKPDVAKPENAHAQALDYVTRTRQLEGSGKDPRSSAVGGFIDSTWLDTIHKIRPETLNMPPEQVLAMRYDESPAGIALRDQATAQYASENSAVLQKAGLPVNPTNLRLAHFLGPGGAVQVLSVPPGTLMSEINPKAVAANPTLQGRTAGEVIQLANDQMNGNTAANMRRTALGPFNEGASAYLQTWQQDIQKRSKEYDDALAEGKDLRSVARAAMAKWELSSENPPKDMRENWNQWAGAAVGLAMLGGFFGKNHTAAINAAGEMLQAANAADVRAYDIAYKRWKDHNDNGLKLIELLHGEARDVINDAKNSYDMTVTKLATLGTMYQLQQHLDPTSVENIEKHLRVQQLTTEVTKAQKEDADIAASVAQKDKALETKEGRPVTATEHSQHIGEAKREMSGTAGAGADAIKAQVYSNTLSAEISRWIAANPGKTEADIPPEDFATMQQRAASVSGYVRGAGAGVGATPKNIQWVDKDGKTQTGMATYDQTKRQYWVLGQPEPLPADTKVSPGPPSGTRVQPQIQRLLGAGSQMEAHLTNLGEMPIGGSIGPFMGIENKTPDEMRDGLIRTATRKLFSTDEIKAMQNEFVGVSRQIAALDSQGAAQGLVGLAKQAEEYAPRSDDSPLIVMRKYASLRQVVEQAMKGVVISGTANADQKAGAQEIVSKVQAAIPYTVHDINQIQFGGQKGSAEAATEIINRRRQELATTELLKHKDDPAYVESFKRHFPNVDIQGILNSGQ